MNKIDDIKTQLFDLELMVEDLKCLSKEMRQGDCKQKIYHIISMLDDLNKEGGEVKISRGCPMCGSTFFED